MTLRERIEAEEIKAAWKYPNQHWELWWNPVTDEFGVKLI